MLSFGQWQTLALQVLYACRAETQTHFGYHLGIVDISWRIEKGLTDLSIDLFCHWCANNTRAL